MSPFIGMEIRGLFTSVISKANRLTDWWAFYIYLPHIFASIYDYLYNNIRTNVPVSRGRTMKNEIMKKELERIIRDLEEVFMIAQEDYSNDKSRYNIGVMVGIKYAKRELERMTEESAE